MPVIYFNVVFDQRDGAYMPGQMVTGKVRILLNNPKIVSKIKIKFEGRAHVEWSDSESDGESRKSVTRSGTENHFKLKLVLDERSENFPLPPGEHVYPFAVLLPKNIPSSFHHLYGDIQYYAVAKIVIPGHLNKVTKEIFKVKNYLNLNDFPDLKAPVEVQKSKKFYYLCCIPGGKVLARVCIPRSGFVGDEQIPLILELNNQSRVRLHKITAYLVRRLEFRATYGTKTSYEKLISFSLGSANGHSSLTLAENVPIPTLEFPYLENSKIILLKHLLQVEADAAGPHCDLDVIIPVTMGDIPFVHEETGEQEIHFLQPPDYDETQFSNSTYVFCAQPNKEIVLSATSLAVENKSAEIFEDCIEE